MKSSQTNTKLTLASSKTSKIQKRSPCCLNSFLNICEVERPELFETESLDKTKYERGATNHYSTNISSNIQKLKEENCIKNDLSPSNSKKSLPISSSIKQKRLFLSKYNNFLLIHNKKGILAKIAKVSLRIEKKDLGIISFVRNEKHKIISNISLNGSILRTDSLESPIHSHGNKIREEIINHIINKTGLKNKLILCIGNDEGCSAIQFAKKNNNVIIFENDILKSDQTLLNLKISGFKDKIDLIETSINMQRRIKTDLIFIALKYSHFIETNDGLVFDEDFSLFKNLYEDIYKTLQNSLLISKNVILLLPKFTNINELAELFADIFEKNYKGSPIHDSIEIEVIFLNNTVDSILVYYGENIVKEIQNEKKSFLLNYILNNKENSSDIIDLLKNLISKIGTFKICQIISKLSPNQNNNNFCLEFLNYCVTKKILKSNMLSELSEETKFCLTSSDSNNESLSFSFNPLRAVLEKEKNNNINKLFAYQFISDEKNKFCSKDNSYQTKIEFFNNSNTLSSHYSGDFNSVEHIQEFNY